MFTKRIRQLGVGDSAEAVKPFTVWAKQQGWVRCRTYRWESKYRAYTLVGLGAWEGWSAVCLNRASWPVTEQQHELADLFQERECSVYYQGMPIYPAKLRPQHLIDGLIGPHDVYLDGFKVKLHAVSIQGKK